MQRTLLSLSLLLLFLSLGEPRAALGSTPLMDVPPPGVESDFHLVSEQEGWLLLNQHLYWTTTAGNSWQEITPAVAPAAIQSVFFLNARTGWVLSNRTSETGSVTFTLARTQDGGKSWQNQPLALFAPGDIRAQTRAASLYFVDAQTGWMVLRQATSSNFVVGTLFRTNDGGKSWTPLSIPIAEPVYFVDGAIGWTAGGPAGDELYRTVDGGRSWQPQTPRDSTTPSSKRFYQLPRFKNGAEGVLFVFAADTSKTQVEIYRSRDRGELWNLENRVSVDQEVASVADLPLAILDPDNWLLIAPKFSTLLSRSLGAALTTAPSRDDKTADLRRLDLGSRQVGWAWYSAGDCAFVAGTASLPKARLNCTLEDSLLKTTDGGQTWQALALPTTGASQVGRRALTASQTYQGQGFDKCAVATLDQLQSWWLASPYHAVNLYIGGVNRHCSNLALTASYLSQMRLQGWRFIPTWVGRQAPCTGTSYPYKISSDTSTAYNQGLSEANDAADVAANLGLGAGSVIYSDIESYDTTNSACRSAVNSFISGWSGQLRARGYAPGAYGSPCSSAISDWAGIANVPDAIWAARWNYSSYDVGASVWGLPCLSDGLWSNHQRIHQYTGGHDETWGGVTLNIDSDVVDGMVADIGVSPPLAPSNPNPADGALLARTSRLTLYWNTNGATCDLHIWGGDVGDQTFYGLGCASAFFGAHYGGSYQWQVTANNSFGSTAGPTWHFYIQPYGPANLRATRISSSQVSLSWTLSADDPAAIDNYRLYRNNSILTTLPAGSSSLTVDDAGCATNYVFYLTAVRQGVESMPSNRLWNCVYFPQISR